MRQSSKKKSIRNKRIKRIKIVRNIEDIRLKIPGSTGCQTPGTMMVPFSEVVIRNNWWIDVLCGDEGKKASVKLDEIVIYWER